MSTLPWRTAAPDRPVRTPASTRLASRAALGLAATAAFSATALTGTVMVAPAASAAATSTSTASSLTATASTAAAAQVAAAARATALRTTVLTQAAALKGRPYRYGAMGPKAFDCSGYTKYVYAKAGISLPRIAQQQLRASQRISKSAVRPGDLIFFVSGGHAYHVAIYAGNGMIWHSPRSGKTVTKVKIWTSSWVAGRVI
jgi:cell wall-associated NlpC family hydrolase